MRFLVLSLFLLFVVAGCAGSGADENLAGQASGSPSLNCDSDNPARKGTTSFTVEIKMFQGDIIMKGKSGKGTFYEGPVTEIGETHYYIENNIGGQFYTLDYWPDPEVEPNVRGMFTIEDGAGTIIREESMVCR